MQSNDRAYPLYDPRFEHDACGVGFVAATRKRQRSRVLPLALTGLGALGHRGAFAADGESSDGAGVLLPLEPELLAVLAPGSEGRPGIVSLFMPADPAAARASRRLVDEALRAQGLKVASERAVPIDAAALGSESRASMPGFIQLVVRSGHGALGNGGLDRRLLLARRHMEMAARNAGLTEFAVASASSRTVVYKGLVSGGRLADLYLDLQVDMALSHAVYHQRYATNTHPTWGLAQPFRLIAHNGEINTVRGGREQLRGRRARLGGPLAEALVASGDLHMGGSDSLSLDETLDLYVASGWRLDAALLLAIVEAPGLRSHGIPELETFRARTRGLLAPWDGPAALCFSDGQRVGAILDRNGLRPLSITISRDGIVAASSEGGAIPIDAALTIERRRLAPGEMFIVDVARGVILGDVESKRNAMGRLGQGHASTTTVDVAPVAPTVETPARERWNAGLDAERLRLDITTMALEGHEPLWSMGDDTPTAGLSTMGRRTADHLRQSFAQVTNPAIDPQRERIVMDLSVEVGRRAPLLGAAPAQARTLHLSSPYVADLDGLERALRGGETGRRHRVRRLAATWDPRDGPGGLETALDRLTKEALVAARSGVEVLIITDQSFARGRAGRAPREPRLPIPSVLAIGAVHTALTDAGMRGNTDIVAHAADILDSHAAAMSVAVGASAVVPWLAVELAAELAGTRGAEDVTPESAIMNLLSALDGGLRKVLARMGISTAASYVGSGLFEVLELHADIVARCFPAAPAWTGRVDLDVIATRQLVRLQSVPEERNGRVRFVDPGFARFRGDGERHLWAPATVKSMQSLAESGPLEGALEEYRSALARTPATIRDQLEVYALPEPLPVSQIEPVETIVRRFAGAAMSLGALSPEAHQALTIGLRRLGMHPNSGEGGEDPEWYDDRDGFRRDAAIKQIASARFGVTSTYLSRAEQLEIKIAQGSKPGEGGQLPAIKVTPLIARLRRAQAGISLISPPPHHDIYSIEDLAQLIADLRAVNPSARIGVKLVSAIGIGTIASGVAKAGADYIHIAGHSGGTGASPLSSIKHVGTPWELGLAEVHQVLMRNDLRDRVALRTDGGLQTGRDVVIAAALGAEEFGFGTAALVALGCDMARQCHADTCPTGVATQRADLRAKFEGTPEKVIRFFTAIAEDVRNELASMGRTSLADVVGDNSLLTPTRDPAPVLDLDRLLTAPAWEAPSLRRAEPWRARLEVQRQPASPLEARLAASYLHLPSVERDRGIRNVETPVSGLSTGTPGAPVAMTTAERAFGAHLSGVIERGLVRRKVEWRLKGAAGQSFGAFTMPSVTLELVGQANDYVGKGLSGGVIVVRPEPELAARASELAVAGNTCLYGATAGRLHLVGRAGIRFCVRNSGAEAVVEGTGPHACEYMTGGIAVILGPVGANLGAGMTGGRAYLWDPDGDRIAGADATSVRWQRLDLMVHARHDAAARVGELRRLLEQHRDAGSLLARDLLERRAHLGDEFWLIEPIGGPADPVDREPVSAGDPAAQTRPRLGTRS
ncbi:MAG TPA: glutamate synthase large subunit [Candidatus Limnocylindrales bacterium]|nr:glutamate synthase large subunit [Candidatus Limnocylindrales bacterium]